MLVSPASFASAVVAVVGTTIFWANPKRNVNRVIFTCSMHFAIWLVCLNKASYSRDGTGLFWFKWTCAVGSWLPVHLGVIKESILTDLAYFGFPWIRRNWLLLALVALLSAVPFTAYFVPAHSTGSNRVYGWAYYAYMVAYFGYYTYLFVNAFLTTKNLTGGRRLELRIWLGGGSALLIAIFITMAMSAITDNRSYVRTQPYFVMVFYTGIAVAITTHRIFDARQILLVALQKVALVLAVAALAFLIDNLVGTMLPQVVALVVTTVVALWFASIFNSWLNNVFQFYPQATAARQAAFAVARRESRLENLETAFTGILKGWGHSDHALLISGSKESLRGGGVELAGDSVAVQALRQLRWVTPERLAREKATPDRVALSEFLEKHNLGALVIGEGPTLTAFIGVGIAASRRPFTFPQIIQLMELASIIESALERAHFSVKAQHAEQLATVGLLGASLAHEIRNPLVSIKTFVQLLPTHHQDPAFREKFFTLIGEEVSRIDRLTEQLLDLASPRAYVAEIIELHPVLRASLDLVAAKASDKRIQFLTDFQASPDQALTDGSAAKQVLLNLCFNAIQAVEMRPGERWVKVSTRNVLQGVEMVVEDSGPGIAPEIRSKLFQPFHSTKSTGFGLGLAICSDILGGLNATISVDTSAPGQGAVFRVIFPCPVLSS